MPSMRNGGMAMQAERGRGLGSKGGSDAPKKKVNLRKLWPTIWTLVKPRRWLIGLGLVLVAIKTVAGLTLPALSKYLLDDVLATTHPRPQMLPTLIGIVFGATVIQAVSSFSLTQLLSKEGQKLISDLRKQVQAHVGRLSVAYYDANRTGALVARIMTDVEGVRNLIGTGLVEFVGGLLTASIALVLLLRISPLMTGVAFALLLVSML